MRKAFNALTPATQTHNESQFFLKKCSFRAKWIQCFISWTKYGRSSRPEGKIFFKKMSLWHKCATIRIYEMDHKRGELKNDFIS